MYFDQRGNLRGRNPYKLNSLWYNPGTNKKHSGNNDLCFYIMWYKATYILPSKVTCKAGGRREADQGRYRGHKRPYVGASHARSWSPLLVLGAILWAFIAKN